jgi:hypothetical protein
VPSRKADGTYWISDDVRGLQNKGSLTLYLWEHGNTRTHIHRTGYTYPDLNGVRLG